MILAQDECHGQEESRERDHQDSTADQDLELEEVAEYPDHEAGEHQVEVGTDGLRQGEGKFSCCLHTSIIGHAALRGVTRCRWLRRRGLQSPPMGAKTDRPAPSSVEDERKRLAEAGYLADESAALVSFLAERLDKPVLVEGPAGVGKTELAKAVARATGRPLVRLQCYEGLDEAKALYEWNYRKQLLHIQARAAADDGAGESAENEIFGEGFLLERPLLTAIASGEPVVLLIDEIDKTDQEFEAMLLEVLSEFQISIPELGPVEATTQPLVFLTSNDSRELTEALKRRCLYLWIDYPSRERELEIVRLHVPDLDPKLAGKMVDVIQEIRELDLKKPPSLSESIDWARTLLLIGADDIDRETLEQSLSIIVKHRTDIDLIAERVAVKLSGPETNGQTG